MSSTSDDRRQFVRIPFHSQVLLKLDETITVCRLLDVSLKGILLEVPADWKAAQESPFSLELALSPSSKEDRIQMQVSLVHREGNQVGFRWDSIHFESFIHLKRLLEVNIGDESELNREIHSLRAER